MTRQEAESLIEYETRMHSGPGNADLDRMLSPRDVPPCEARPGKELLVAFGYVVALLILFAAGALWLR